MKESHAGFGPVRIYDATGKLKKTVSVRKLKSEIWKRADTVSGDSEMLKPKAKDKSTLTKVIVECEACLKKIARSRKTFRSCQSRLCKEALAKAIKEKGGRDVVRKLYLENFNCHRCGEPFIPNQKNSKYCESPCNSILVAEENRVKNKSARELSRSMEVET